MQKRVYHFLAGIISVAVFIIISAQSDPENQNTETNLPVALKIQLDSFRRSDMLAEWLYSYRAYVYEDPAKRISILSKAQSSAWRNPETDAEREEWFNCLAAQGYYLLYGGNILRSIDAYEQAYQFYFDKAIPGADVLEYVLKPLGNNYTRLGDYDRAFFIQGKSLALAEGKDSSQVASICHNLATTSVWKEELNLAEQYCSKGILHVTKKSALHGLLLSTLAEVYLKSGDRDSALVASKAAISILTDRLKNKPENNVAYWLRGAWQGLGNIQKENNEPASALASYQRAIALIDIYYRGQRKREKAKLFVSSGQMLLMLDEPRKAMEKFNEALSIMVPSFRPGNPAEIPENKYLYGENTLLDALHGKADCLFLLNKKDEALRCYLLLYSVEKKLRNEFFGNTAKQQQQKENRQWAEKAMETAFDLWQASGKKEYAEKILLIAEMSKAQLLLDEMQRNLQYSRVKSGDTLLIKQQQMLQAIALYEKDIAQDTGDSVALAAKKELEFDLSLIQKQVKDKYPVQADMGATEELMSIDSLLQGIEAGTFVLEFFTGERNIYIIEAEKNSVKTIRRINNAGSVLDSFQRFVDTYFQSGPANMMNMPGEYYKAAFRVYRTLFIGAGIKPGTDFIVIPDGILGYIPFDALVTDSVYEQPLDQWPFLVKQTNLYLNYSLQTRWQQKKSIHPSRAFAGFFISFDSSESSIPAVKKEYEKTAAVMKGNYFTDKQATLSAFTKQLGEVNLLHISTHAFLQGKENMPVLQLADDKFFLFELYGKTFHPQLVVLSACRTGHGMLAKGEGIISLARGFTAAGSRGIIAGLWDLNDEITATLMGNFYKELSGGKNPALALRHAKLKWLEGNKAQQLQKLPYFWAGMVYSGDNQSVITDAKGKKYKWGLIIAVIATILGLIFFIKNRPASAQHSKL